jgi:hypothetical protein
MPVAGIFNRQFMQAKLSLHGFKLRWLRIRQSDPDEAVWLMNIEVNLANLNIGELAAILIGDTIDKHCSNLSMSWNLSLDQELLKETS